MAEGCRRVRHLKAGSSCLCFSEELAGLCRARGKGHDTALAVRQASGHIWDQPRAPLRARKAVIEEFTQRGEGICRRDHIAGDERADLREPRLPLNRVQPGHETEGICGPVHSRDSPRPEMRVALPTRRCTRRNRTPPTPRTPRPSATRPASSPGCHLRDAARRRRVEVAAVHQRAFPPLVGRPGALDRMSPAIDPHLDVGRRGHLHHGLDQVDPVRPAPSQADRPAPRMLSVPWPAQKVAEPAAPTCPGRSTRPVASA